MTTKERVHKIIMTHLCCDADQVRDETVLTDDLGADSLDVVELQMALEEEFSIEIGDDEMDEIRTVGQAVALIEKKTA